MMKFHRYEVFKNSDKTLHYVMAQIIYFGFISWAHIFDAEQISSTFELHVKQNPNFSKAIMH